MSVCVHVRESLYFIALMKVKRKFVQIFSIGNYEMKNLLFMLLCFHVIVN